MSDSSKKYVLFVSRHIHKLKMHNANYLWESR